MFQSLRQGQTLYVLEKGEKPVLRAMQVTCIGLPVPKYNTSMPAAPGQWTEMVIDVKAHDDSGDVDLQKLPAGNTIASVGNMVVTESREAMQAEVEGMQKQSQAVLDSVTYHEGVIESTAAMLKVLNPQFARDAERDEQVASLRADVDGMRSSLEDIKGMLAKMTK